MEAVDGDVDGETDGDLDGDVEGNVELSGCSEWKRSGGSTEGLLDGTVVDR